MKTSKNYLAIDIGASNGRVIAGKFNGRKIEMEVAHRFDNIPVYAAGTLYWDILRLYSEIKTGLRYSFKKYNNLISAGIDTWGVDFCFIDKNGRLAANPIHYRDMERNNVFNELLELIPKRELFRLTGGPVESIFSIFLMFYLKINNAAEFKNAFKFLMIPDIFNYFLTGKKYNEYTNAVSTLMVNQVEKKWEFKLLDRLGIPKDIFCEIIEPGTVLGGIKADEARELEINSLSIVAPATMDTASAMSGIPVVDESQSKAFISLGTWGIIAKETEKPLINDEVLSAGFANECEAEGINILFKNLTALWIIQQCREKWIKDYKRNINWDEIVNLTKTAKPFRQFIDVDDKIFSISLNDMPEKIRSYCRGKNQKVPEELGEISRCIYEGIALKIRFNLEVMEKLAGNKIKQINIVGGGIQNKLLCQWISNAAGVALAAGPAETTSIGNIIMQLKADKEIKNLKEGRQLSFNSTKLMHYYPEEREIWDEAFHKYLRFCF
jgi:rhamnulokinase